MVKETKRFHLKYFAVLREQAGTDAEVLDSVAPTAGDLYAELQQRFGWHLNLQAIKVAINGTYRPMQSPLAGGDEIVFIPPVAGG